MLSKLVLKQLNLSLGLTQQVDSIVLDSRLAGANSLFFAIKGEKTDGRLYLKQVLDLGASAVCDKIDLPESLQEFTHDRLILVDNLDAKITEIISGITKSLREAGSKVIAVTGSSGKTSTKFMLYQVLSKIAPTLVTKSSYNTIYGLLLSLSQASEKDKYVVLELGVSKPGDMEILASAVKPDRSIVLNVGLAHVGNFYSAESQSFNEASLALKQEKLKLVKYTSEVSAVNQNLSDYMSSTNAVVKYFNSNTYNSSCLSVRSGIINTKAGSFEVNLQHLIGCHMIQNMTAIVALLDDLIDTKSIIASAEEAPSVQGRGKLHQDLSWRNKRFSLYDSSYNSNLGPAGSLFSELKTVSELGKSVVAVIGYSVELGNQQINLHQQAMEEITKFCKSTIFVGELWGDLAVDSKHLLPEPVNSNNLDHLLGLVSNIVEDDCVLFIKGSNINNLSLLVNTILETSNA
jgi:UDP-N-acetylmuramoyl-tripeptide--D-alanyl-D-alanine ligase